MALRVRNNDIVVCAAEEPPMLGDVYIDDRLHYLLSIHFEENAGPCDPALCWECKEDMSRICERCKQFGLK